MRLTELLESIDLEIPREGDQMIIDLPDGTSVMGLIAESSSSYLVVDVNHAEELKEAVGQRYYDAELTIPNPDYSDELDIEDENDPRYYSDIDVGVNYSISGSYRPATWGYHGGEPEEHPEMEITDVVNLQTGEDISDRVDMDEIEAELWKHAEASADDDYYDESVEEAAPAAVRLGAGLGMGALSGIGGNILGAVFGPLGSAALGGYSAYQGAKLGMSAADAIWDKAVEFFKGPESTQDFAFAHLRAAAKGDKEFVFGGKKFPVTLPASQVKSAQQVMAQVKESINEAEYAGRKVQLGKPKRGGRKKFYVFVRNPKTKRIVKVQFGDTTGLSIKRQSTKHRKSFRARHNCENPGPRTKARYWSCRMWSSQPVGKIIKGK